MTLKQLITNSYSKEIYNTTEKFQEQKIKNAISKNQLIFLQRCVSNHIFPPSLKVRSPIKSKKAENITKEYRRRLLIPETKQNTDFLQVRILFKIFVMIWKES